MNVKQPFVLRVTRLNLRKGSFSTLDLIITIKTQPELLRRNKQSTGFPAPFPCAGRGSHSAYDDIRNFPTQIKPGIWPLPFVIFRLFAVAQLPAKLQTGSARRLALLRRFARH